MFLGIAVQLVKVWFDSAGCIIYLVLFAIVSFLVITWKRIVDINLTKAENDGFS